MKKINTNNYIFKFVKHSMSTTIELQCCGIIDWFFFYLRNRISAVLFGLHTLHTKLNKSTVFFLRINTLISNFLFFIQINLLENFIKLIIFIFNNFYSLYLLITNELKNNWKIIHLNIFVNLFLSYIKYFIFEIIENIFGKIKNDANWLELQGFVALLFAALLFYYFIIIEFSIFLFGYSLLCYWYGFFVIFICAVSGWRFTVFFLKNCIDPIHLPLLTDKDWLKYYKFKTPYSFFDHITFYRYKKRFYKLMKIAGDEDLEDFLVDIYTFLYFIIVFSFVGIAYSFDSWYYKFIALNFHSFMTFWESRAVAKTTDMLYAAIWFRSLLVKYFIYKHATGLKSENEFIVPDWLHWRLSYVPAPSKHLNTLALTNRRKEISFTPRSSYGDILLASEAYKFLPLKRLLFSEVQPMLIGQKSVQNMDILLLWYLRSQFRNDGKETFWSKYFTNDIVFWNMFSNLKKEQDFWIETYNKIISDNFIYSKSFAPTFEDALLSINYLNTEPFSSSWEANNQGRNLDISGLLEEFELNNLASDSLTEDFLKPIFSSVYIKEPYTSASDLYKYLKLTENKKSWKDFIWQKLYEINNLYLIYDENWNNFFNLNTIKDIFFYQNNTPFEYYHDSSDLNFSNLKEKETLTWNMNMLSYFWRPLVGKHYSTSIVPTFYYTNQLNWFQAGSVFIDLCSVLDFWLTRLERYFSLPIRWWDSAWLWLMNPETLPVWTESRLYDIECALHKKHPNFFKRKLLNLPLQIELEYVKQVLYDMYFGKYKPWKPNYWKAVPKFFTKEIFNNLITIDIWLKNFESYLNSLNSKIQLKFYINNNFDNEVLKICTISDEIIEYINSINNNKINKNLNNWTTLGYAPRRFYILDSVRTNKFSKIYLKWKNVRDNYPNPNLRFSKSENVPWYIRSLNYIKIANGVTGWSAPGFVSYFYPTPYSGSFSSSGFFIHRYNEYLHEYVDKHTVSIAFVEVGKKNIPQMSGNFVETYAYFSMLMEPIRIISRYFTFLINKIIIFLLSFDLKIINDNLITLLFFINIKWFLYHYIYLLIIVLLLYQVHKYYSIYGWQRWSLMDRFFDKYLYDGTQWIYWYTVTEIWTYFWSEEQLSFFKIKTNLLLHLSMQQYSNYICIGSHCNNPLITILLKLAYEYNISLLKYDLNALQEFFLEKKKTKNHDFQFFNSFFNISMKKYTVLLYEGGPDVSPDNLVWSYYNYLSQVSIWLSWGLWKNYYNINKNSWIISLMKNFTMAMSAQSLTSDFLFLSLPLLDTQLNRTLLQNLIRSIIASFSLKENFFVSPFFFKPMENWLPLAYGLLCGYKSEMFSLFNFSGYSIYSLLNSNLTFLSKINTTTFWNDPKYWIFAFFRSFRFVSKVWLPNINIYSTHELTKLQLSWQAHTNSWIGYSMFVRPFYYTLQQLWWTTPIHWKSFLGVSKTYELNIVLEDEMLQTRNFSEKWYNNLNNNKNETIFGLSLAQIVISDTITNKYSLRYNRNYKEVNIKNPENNNLLFYNPEDSSRIGTVWDYNKLLPPIDLTELGITPLNILDIFKFLPKNYKFLYCSFLNQINKSDLLKQYFNDIDIAKIYKSMTEEFNDSEEWIDFFFKFPFLYEEVALYDLSKSKFQKNLSSSRKNLLEEWIFGFDVSYFFSHFTTWDFFVDSLNLKWPQKLNFDNLNTTERTLQNQVFADINADLFSISYWSYKPLGLLDKAESLSIRWYKHIKLLDIHGTPRNKIDPFALYEKEIYNSNVGVSNLNFENPVTIWDAYYEEDIFGKREYNWFPNNNSLVGNWVTPILLGWVGELNIYTCNITNMLFSVQYASANQTLDAWWQSNVFSTQNISIFDMYNRYINMYFGFNSYSLSNNSLVSKIHTWVNFVLSPVSNWYSFGPKAVARRDHWSWRCGFEMDYLNGFYSYWPYSGLRHSFGTRMSVFDPTYGNYRMYRQLQDNPFMIDFTTDAMNVIVQSFETEADELLGGIYEAAMLQPKDTRRAKEKWSEESEDLKFWEHNPYYRKYSINVEEHVTLATFPEFVQHYWETYYCFHHPYFLGYYMFWYIIFMAKEILYGVANYSYWRVIVQKLRNVFFDENFSKLTSINFNLFRTKIENNYWKYMYRYWMYWMNPIKLTNNFQLWLDKTDINSTVILNINDYLFSTYLYTNKLFSFLESNLGLTAGNINFICDIKWHDLILLWINFLSLEMPFCLNPYIVTTNTKSLFSLFDASFIYNKCLPHMQFAHHDTLRESFNINTFYDWSTGVYMDSLNLSSYYSTYKSYTGLTGDFFDYPDWRSISWIYDSSDNNKLLAFEDVRSSRTLSITNFDITISTGLLLNNLSLLHFLSSTFKLLVKNAIVSNPLTIFNFENFFYDENFYKEINWIKFDSYLNFWDSHITIPLWSMLTHVWQKFFTYWFYWWIPFDILNFWISTGIFFFSQNFFKILAKSIRLKLFLWFYYSEQFYKRIGYIISKQFKKNIIFKKKIKL